MQKSGTFRSDRIRSLLYEKSGTVCDASKYSKISSSYFLHSGPSSSGDRSMTSYKFSTSARVNESRKSGRSFDCTSIQFLRNETLFHSEVGRGIRRGVVSSEKSNKKIVWKEARREYVINATLSTGRDVNIPLIYALRAPICRYEQTEINGKPKQQNSIPLLSMQLSSHLLSPLATFSDFQKNDQHNHITARYYSQRATPNRKLETTDIPIPASAPPVQSNPLERLKKETPKGLIRKGLDLTISLFRTVITFLLKMPGNIFYFITHPKERQESIDGLRNTIKHEIDHYWNGTKLLWADIQTAQSLLSKTLKGSSLTRRERRQLLRTVSDLFRLIPFSMFVIIPFMEFALPLALRLFPNLLPSTYQDSLKAEENMKRELKSRIAMAQFFQE